MSMRDGGGIGNILGSRVAGILAQDLVALGPGVPALHRSRFHIFET